MPRSLMQHLMVVIDMMQQMVYLYRPMLGRARTGLFQNEGEVQWNLEAKKPAIAVCLALTESPTTRRYR